MKEEKEKAAPSGKSKTEQNGKASATAAKKKGVMPGKPCVKAEKPEK